MIYNAKIIFFIKIYSHQSQTSVVLGYVQNTF
uniref:Uncharacterized protein n=1 Tax=Arundo donax TaxID=35708 RepID=A0A0A9BXW2_ARUDO